jgi:phage-related protein
VKEVRFLGSSRDELRSLPASVRSRAGHELYLIQIGEAPSDFKSMSSIGPGACEIRIRDDAGTFRVIYVAKFAAFVYVLHAFQKKSQSTSLQALRIARQRYRMIEDK